MVHPPLTLTTQIRCAVLVEELFIILCFDLQVWVFASPRHFLECFIFSKKSRVGGVKEKSWSQSVTPLYQIVGYRFGSPSVLSSHFQHLRLTQLASPLRFNSQLPLRLLWSKLAWDSTFTSIQNSRNSHSRLPTVDSQTPRLPTPPTFDSQLLTHSPPNTNSHFWPSLPLRTPNCRVTRLHQFPGTQLELVCKDSEWEFGSFEVGSEEWVLGVGLVGGSGREMWHRRRAFVLPKKKRGFPLSRNGLPNFYNVSDTWSEIIR